MKFRTVAKLAFVLLILPCFGVAQNTSSGETLPKFTSRSEVVLVPIVVTDNQGQAVSGLTKADFTVKENGKQQEIVSLEEINPGQGPLRQWLPAGYTYSNANEVEQTPRQVNVIVLDLLNTPFLMHAQIRRGLMSYLQSQLEGDGRQAISLVVLSYPIAKTVHPPTADPAVLKAALQWLTAGKGIPELSAHDATLPFPEGSSNRLLFENEVRLLAGSEKLPGGKSLYQIQNVPQLQRDILPVTLRCMEQLAQAYTGVSGRKAVLWITAGFPFDMTDRDDRSLNANNVAYESYKRMWAAFNKANISLYPIDARGTVSDNLVSDVTQLDYIPQTSSRGPAQDARERDYSRQTFFETIANNQDRRYNLTDFAEATGGRACYNTNDLTRCYARALQDSSRYYMLAYRITSQKRGWRDISVNVDRKDVKIYARKGYFYGNAVPENRDSANDQINVALISGFDYTGLSFAANLKFQGTKSPDRVFRAEINIPFQSLQIGPDNLVKLRFIAVLLKHDGTFQRLVGETLAQPLSANDIAAIQRTGLRFSEQITVPPGEGSLKIMLIDDQSGNMGTITAPVS